MNHSRIRPICSGYFKNEKNIHHLVSLPACTSSNSMVLLDLHPSPKTPTLPQTAARKHLRGSVAFRFQNKIIIVCHDIFICLEKLYINRYNYIPNMIKILSTTLVLVISQLKPEKVEMLHTPYIAVIIIYLATSFWSHGIQVAMPRYKYL